MFSFVVVHNVYWSELTWIYSLYPILGVLNFIVNTAVSIESNDRVPIAILKSLFFSVVSPKSFARTSNTCGLPFEENFFS